MGNKQKGKIQKIIKDEEAKKFRAIRLNNTKARKRVAKRVEENKDTFGKSFNVSSDWKESEAKTIKNNRERRLQKYGHI